MIMLIGDVGFRGDNLGSAFLTVVTSIARSSGMRVNVLEKVLRSGPFGINLGWNFGGDVDSGDVGGEFALEVYGVARGLDGAVREYKYAL
jgi:hypothetical protein